MRPSGNLLAWIEPRGSDHCVGAFVGEDAVTGDNGHYAGRAPAMQMCSSPDEARRWVEDQAIALGLPVKWVSGIQRN